MGALEQLILESAVRSWLRPQKTNDQDVTALRIGKDGGARRGEGQFKTTESQFHQMRKPAPTSVRAGGSGPILIIIAVLLPSTGILA